MPSTARTWPRTWSIWLSLYAIVTLCFARFDRLPELRTAHGVLVYLLLIIGASRQGGRWLSLVMVALGYLAVDRLFVPPRVEFRTAKDFDLLILIGFLITGVVISQLFAGLQRAVRLANERFEEVARLSEARVQLEREAAAARSLRDADRLKNTLLLSLSHDLRSPVATLALLSDPQSAFTPDAAMPRVRDQAERLGEFIQTLQRFAKSGGGSPLEMARHDADVLVQTALRSSEALLLAREVRVSWSTDARLAVRCDFTLALQVLGNLLQNAARYSPPGTPIDVMIVPGTHLTEIVVADRGPGVSETDLERIFAPLDRRASPCDAQQERMGVGLSIARMFARAQRGDVRYRAREGGGSAFVLVVATAHDSDAT
ncbi:ATP-binding protein [Gemmatimonas sp.]|jgi:two-component system sensor histidine kinase KdpD|uniref:sensor histidine kinase n=1 Tax=Gemmatimonas sp. TaxID=1962908 RepID=UPI0037BF51BC